MRRSIKLLLALSLAGGLAACGDTSQDPLGPTDPSLDRGALTGPLVVQSQNLYLGANIDLLLSGADPTTVIGDAYGQLVVNNAGNMGRALALAGEIATNRPHLVGLQEVTRYEVSADGITWAPLADYVTALQAYLAFLGLPGGYDVAVRQDNVSLTLPLVLGGVFQGYIRYTDGEAILVRSDVDWWDAAAAHYTEQVELTVAGHTFDNLRGWNAVTAMVDGQTVRFVNTHLEIQRFREVQEAQARELAELFEGEELPVVLVGDFNSAANPDASADQVTDSYRILRRAGYADLWLRQPDSRDGLTCCFDALLTDPDPTLHSRLDLVLARYGPAGFGGQASMEVVGEEPGDRIEVMDAQLGTLWLWPSDHAGVVAELWPAPGTARTLAVN